MAVGRNLAADCPLTHHLGWWLAEKSGRKGNQCHRWLFPSASLPSRQPLHLAACSCTLQLLRCASCSWPIMPTTLKRWFEFEIIHAIKKGKFLSWNGSLIQLGHHTLNHPSHTGRYDIDFGLHQALQQRREVQTAQPRARHWTKNLHVWYLNCTSRGAPQLDRETEINVTTN